MVRRRVGVGARDGTGEQLSEIGDAAGDVAAHVVLVVRLKVTRRHAVSREDAIAKAGGEALDLALNHTRHIERRAARYVAVGPSSVLSGRSTGRIEQALLGDEYKGAFGMDVAPHFG